MVESVYKEVIMIGQIENALHSMVGEPLNDVAKSEREQNIADVKTYFGEEEQIKD